MWVSSHLSNILAILPLTSICIAYHILAQMRMHGHVCVRASCARVLGCLCVLFFVFAWICVCVCDGAVVT